MSKKIKVKCPTCEKEFFYYDSEFRPFCTERCKMIDLGHWFNEEYAVPSKEPLSEEAIEEVIRKSENDQKD